MKIQSDELVLQTLDEIKALLKILALQNFKDLRHSILSTKNKERIYELCTGEKEMNEIAKQVNVSNESVRLAIRDFESSGIVITKRRGGRGYPKKVI